MIIMANIEKNLKNVNLMKAALVFFFPDGTILSIDKIKGKEIHFEYLYTLSKSIPQF